MHIVDVVYYWARSAPLRPAFIETSGVVTYATLANGIEFAAEHFAASIEDRSRPVALCIASGSKMLTALLGLLRAGFDVVLSGTNVFKELKPLGTTTLVYERDLPTLDGAQNIMFDDNWLHFGFAAEKTQAVALRERTRAQHSVLHVWHNWAPEGRDLSAKKLAGTGAVPGQFGFLQLRENVDRAQSAHVLGTESCL